MSRLFFIALYCFFHTACSFDWRESIAWRDSYAEISSYYALTGFALPSWSRKMAQIHRDSEDFQYYIDFSTDFARFGLPLDYIVAMRAWQANPLERLLLWNSLFPLANLTLNHTDTAPQTFHRLSYPYALSLDNEIHVLSLVQSRLTGFITSDFDTTVSNRRLERVMCGIIVTVFKQMEVILRELDRDSSDDGVGAGGGGAAGAGAGATAITNGPINTNSSPLSSTPGATDSSPALQKLLRVVATVVPADDVAYRVLRASFLEYVNVQLQPLLDLHHHQQQPGQGQEQQQQPQPQQQPQHQQQREQQQQQQQQQPRSSNKATILEEVRVNESYYQVVNNFLVHHASFTHAHHCYISILSTRTHTPTVGGGRFASGGSILPTLTQPKP